MTILQYVKDFATPDVEGNYPRDLQLEPIHQTIKLKFDIPNFRVVGSVTTKVKANVLGANKITFDAIDLEIIAVDGVDHWQKNDESLSFFWNKNYEKGEERSFTIQYIIDHPISGLYFCHPDAAYPDRASYAITDTESIRTRYWLPCIDHLSVRCSIDFYLTSDESHTMLANGKFIDEVKNGDGTKTSHWSQTFPCPSYLITLAVGEFVSYQDRAADAGKGQIPVAYYAPKGYTSAQLKTSFEATPKFLEWMAKKLKCPLEWDKYYQIATFHHGGAMENISFVTWGDFAILNEKEALEMLWIVDDVNAHEMSHSWFGDMIVCKEFSHAWLKEGWATYMETVYFEDFYGHDENLYGLFCDARSYMKESDSKYARPIVTNKYSSSWDMYDMHLYPGGAWRLHMLRSKLGEDIFWTATSDYLNTFKGKVVETIDFQRKMEEHSGLSLEAFFEQWLYKPGYPKLKAEFSYNEKSELASLKVTQTQEDKDKEIGLFNFPLEVQWESADGQIDQRVFEIKEKEQTLYFKVDKKPLQVVLDPECKTLFSLEFNPGDELLIRQLTHKSVILRILAARELLKKGKKKNLEAVLAAYRKEKFWGVRIEMAKELAKSPTFAAIEGLVSLLESETDPMVLQDFIPNLSGMQYPIVFDAMKKFLQRPETLYWATGAALKVIGSQHTKEAYDFLLQYQIGDGFKSLIESSLYMAIGNTRTPEALDYLLAKLPYGKVSERARRAIYSSIAECLTWQEKSIKQRTIATLLSHLKQEQSEAMVQNMIRSFSQSTEMSLTGGFNEAKAKIASQSHPMVERIVKKIKERQDPEKIEKKFSKDMDDLKSQVKKLLARIEELEAKSTTE
ncbi:hypothetical protein NEF87_001775 [Candidatus Lokiarchaeum ossiferum]|uniref:Aminopeptidase N n=1 Tax=Candidatus Lokiarchaeum ossiferum TaxID=2951803 RepID=A0ABY6HPP6_9ARCH|nr:hypothetical protein NEF87_001775 [Candidatus Lokiarchaeum sp. B-35]